MIVDIHVVFRGQDTDEGHVPGIHRRSEFLEQEDRFSRSVFPISEPDLVDLCIMDGCAIEQYVGNWLLGYRDSRLVGAWVWVHPAARTRQAVITIARMEMCDVFMGNPRD